MEPAGRVEHRLCRAQALGQRREDGAVQHRAGADRCARDLDLVERRLAAQAAARVRGEAPLVPREVDRSAEPDRDDVVLLGRGRTVEAVRDGRQVAGRRGARPR